MVDEDCKVCIKPIPKGKEGNYNCKFTWPNERYLQETKTKRYLVAQSDGPHQLVTNTDPTTKCSLQPPSTVRQQEDSP